MTSDESSYTVTSANRLLAALGRLFLYGAAEALGLALADRPAALADLDGPGLLGQRIRPAQRVMPWPARLCPCGRYWI